MTKEELIDCLGTIAQSGTSKFLNALKVSSSLVSVSRASYADNCFYFILFYLGLQYLLC